MRPSVYMKGNKHYIFIGSLIKKITSDSKFFFMTANDVDNEIRKEILDFILNEIEDVIAPCCDKVIKTSLKYSNDSKDGINVEKVAYDLSFLGEIVTLYINFSKPESCFIMWGSSEKIDKDSFEQTIKENLKKWSYCFDWENKFR